MDQNRRSCVAVWFSGFFGLGAVVHSLRLLLRIPVTIGTFHIPLGASIIAVIVFGALSVWLLVIGCKQCKK